MKTEKRLTAEGGGSGGAVPCPAVVGPLLGLVYILIFPYVVFGTLARVSGSWAIRGLTARWRRVSHSPLA